ncbi:hypothetical protein CEXT_351321 [Caerostris extrusa]|uniref:LRRCT domain-containing protein n=1 Tax=Caerostris extrusa TaxID=172846 RepID=A0AAV4VH45_CAEEX|nr:hypothetical protein CEXT_351321 [Caerostris extrusa]
MSSLTGLYLKGNRIATLGSKIHALTQLRILSISNNQIRTITTTQLPPKLTHLFLAGNPFLCNKQMLPFLQFLNSTENLTTDDVCTPSQNGSALRHRGRDRGSELVQQQDPVFGRGKASQSNEVPFSRSQPHTQASRFPLLESQKFLTRVTLSNNPWTCDCTALDLKKWVVSKSILVLDVNEARCGPGMPNNPGLAERAIWVLPDRELCPDNTGLYISMGFGVVSKALHPPLILQFGKTNLQEISLHYLILSSFFLGNERASGL